MKHFTSVSTLIQTLLCLSQSLYIICINSYKKKSTYLTLHHSNFTNLQTKPQKEKNINHTKKSILIILSKFIQLHFNIQQFQPIIFQPVKYYSITVLGQTVRNPNQLPFKICFINLQQLTNSLATREKAMAQNP